MNRKKKMSELDDRALERDAHRLERSIISLKKRMKVVLKIHYKNNS